MGPKRCSSVTMYYPLRKGKMTPKVSHSFLVTKGRATSLDHWMERAGPPLRIDRRGTNGCIETNQ